jgi:hypothetical protein
MAASRIPDLDVLNAAGTAANDYLVIYDSSTDTTKKILKSELSSSFSSDLAASAIIAKLLTVDGAGSLLDADLLDGVQLAALALLAGAAFTGNVSVGGALGVTGTATFGKAVSTQLEARIDLVTIASDTTLTAAAHANRQIFTGNILTLNQNVFTAGDWVVLNATADARFARGSGLTMYSDGTNVATVYVRPWRSAVAIFDSATVCRIVGGTVTPP